MSLGKHPWDLDDKVFKENSALAGPETIGSFWNCNYDVFFDFITLNGKDGLKVSLEESDDFTSRTNNLVTLWDAKTKKDWYSDDVLGDLSAEDIAERDVPVWADQDNSVYSDTYGGLCFNLE